MINWFKAFFRAAPVATPGDPFAHPAIVAMSPRELADLPLTPPPAPSSAPRRARVAQGRPCPAA